jgi:hypothetical protein
MRASWVAAGLVCLLGACAGGGRNPAGAGGVRIAFTMPGGVRIDAVNYRVLLSQSATVMSGTMDTSDQSAALSISVVVPPDPGALVELTATTSTGVSCAGSSAPFPVLSGSMIAVVVQLVCGDRAAPPEPGIVNVSATVTLGNHCPSIVTGSVTPAQVTVGGTIDVSIAATDPDPGETVSVSWSATAGTFSNPGAAATQYVCQQSGRQTLTVTATDSHQPSCSAVMSFPIICVAPTLCATCELQGSQQGHCGGTSNGPGDTIATFGCASFTGPDQASCVALHACLDGAACRAAIAAADASYNEAARNFDSPAPCLCGDLSSSDCLTATTYTGVCASQYLTAAAGGSLPALFTDPSSPVGVASNLFSCDVDQACALCPGT